MYLKKALSNLDTKLEESSVKHVGCFSRSPPSPMMSTISGLQHHVTITKSPYTLDWTQRVLGVRLVHNQTSLGLSKCVLPPSKVFHWLLVEVELLFLLKCRHLAIVGETTCTI